MDKPVDILLAEDNPADAVILREALSNTGWKFRLHVTHDGMETLDFLNTLIANPDIPLPDLIVMDHNMPKKNGLEVLTELRKAPKLSNIPVIILSGSELERRMVAAFGIPEDHYIVKPVTYTGYLGIAELIKDLLRKFTDKTDSAVQ